MLALSTVPNPFRDRIDLRFDLPRELREVRIEIFDAGGRRVATIPMGSLEAGTHHVEWDGSTEPRPNASLGAMEGGIYFARIAHADGTGNAVRMTRVP